MSLLLTVAKQPISKICIPAALGDSFLPCRDAAQPGSFTEEQSCQEKVYIDLFICACFSALERRSLK